MSRSLNKTTLIGNVGNDPEIRTTSGGQKVAKLSLATSRSWAGRDGQQQEKTEWHRITFFGKLADVVEQWVKKGARLYVEGRLEYSQTQDDQGGTKYWTDIVVNEMIMLGGPQGADEGSRGGARSAAPAAAATSPAGGFSGGDEDLPF